MKFVVISGVKTHETCTECAKYSKATKGPTVADLIAILEKFTPDSPVVCSSNDWWDFATIDDIEECDL